MLKKGDGMKKKRQRLDKVTNVSNLFMNIKMYKLMEYIVA